MQVIIDEIETLTTEEFAKKLKIKKPTIEDWIRTGHLVDGKHYIKVRSVVRFLWPIVLFQLLSDCNGDKHCLSMGGIHVSKDLAPLLKGNLAKEDSKKSDSEKFHQEHLPVPKPKRQPVINLDYS